MAETVMVKVVVHERHDLQRLLVQFQIEGRQLLGSLLDVGNGGLMCKCCWPRRIS